MLLKRLAVFLFLFVGACGEPVPPSGNARILLMGDSMMAANQGGDAAVSNVLERLLGQEVIDRSLLGARYFYLLPVSGAAGLRIPNQYRPGKWDWVVLNGGGNDLLFGCGCGACSGMLDRLVSRDGRSGAIPDFVSKIRSSGARVVYAGYLRNPGVQSLVKGCAAAGNELDRRLTIMAGHDSGVSFVPMSDIVPYGDRSFHQFDLIHPSIKGSQAIAIKIARQIRGTGPRKRGPRPYLP